MADPATAARWIDTILTQERLYPGGEGRSFRLAPAPVSLPDPVAKALPELGSDLAAFLAALIDLYWRSEKDETLAFARHYLDLGKNEFVQTAGRLNRLKRVLPQLIRPDLFLTEDGLKITEIDAVPGGFGMLAAFQQGYSGLGLLPQGGPFGVLDGFYGAMADVAGRASPRVAVVVSDEAEDYRTEMEYLAGQLRAGGHPVQCCHPRDLVFSEEGLRLDGQPVDVVYRFFELFDVKNVPKSELIWYAARKGLVHLNPPMKTYLEEKLVFALAHHPGLEPFFEEQIGKERLRRLRRLFPETWVIDPSPLPAQAVIHGLRAGGRPVRDFSELKTLHKSARADWVLKPSGFSPLAWGSRGLVVGADRSQEDWSVALDQAFSDFHRGLPWILQRYHKPIAEHGSYVDLETGQEVAFVGRSRYCPYFFRRAEEVALGGTLVTTVPADKKAVHGMSVAVMAPAAERSPKAS